MSLPHFFVDRLMGEIGGTDGQRLEAAALLSHEGAVLAQSHQFPQFKPGEFHAIMDEFKEPGSLSPKGLFLGGEEYTVIQGGTGVEIRGKKGAGGACIINTGKTVLFGIYEEPVTPGQCNLVVQNMGNCLINLGF